MFDTVAPTNDVIGFVIVPVPADPIVPALSAWNGATVQTLTVPPDVQAPLPTEPVSVKVVVPVDATTKVPFAAVFPATPATVTVCPVDKPCAVLVVIAIGVAMLAAVTTVPAMLAAAIVSDAVLLYVAPVAGLATWYVPGAKGP